MYYLSSIVCGIVPDLDLGITFYSLVSGNQFQGKHFVAGLECKRHRRRALYITATVFTESVHMSVIGN